MITVITKSSFVILFLLTSCISKEKKTDRKGYTITGHVKHIPATRIYMNAMVLDTAGQPKWPIIDSADYNNETFILNHDTTLTEPAWATSIFYMDSFTKKKTDLGFNNKYFSTKGIPSKYASIILENAAMRIDGDINDKNGLNLKGAKETDFEFHYGLMEPPYDKLSVISKKMDSARQTTDTSVLALYRQQKDSLLRDYKTKFEKIISQHRSYFQALSNIYNNADYFSSDELEELIDELDKKLLILPTGKKLIGFVQQKKKLSLGNIFPDFIYMDTTGKKISLNEVKGNKGTLIVFWASWCKPCREEIPEIKNFYKQYVSKEISIVSISVDNNIIKWEKALLQEQMPWYNLSNLPGDYNKIYSKYNIKEIPLMFLLDSDNKILLANPSSIQEIKDKLKQKGISTS